MWASASSRSALAALTAVATLAAATLVPAQPPGRVATTAATLVAEPVFFHGRTVAIHAAVVETPAGYRLAVGDAAADTGGPVSHPVYVYWREAPSRSEGEIRGQFWDLGRLQADDSRFSAYDFRTMLDRVNNGRWPVRDEIYVLTAATIEEAEVPTAPGLRAIALDPQRFADRGVTVTGRFRGRNLYGDLPTALNRSKYDFVIQSADAAVWVSGLRPRTREFELDPAQRVDTGRWVEISGTLHVEGTAVWIEGESIRQGIRPSETPEVPATPVIQMPRPEVVFSAPIAAEQDVARTVKVRIQFSRDMRSVSFRDQVRVSYIVPAGAPTPPSPPSFTVTYREGTRALEISFSQPLERFQVVKVDLLGGVAASDGQTLAPWSLTFTTGD